MSLPESEISGGLRTWGVCAKVQMNQKLCGIGGRSLEKSVVTRDWGQELE